MSVDEALAMDVIERAERRLQRLTRFDGGERAVRQYLRKVLFGALRHNVEELHAVEFAAAGGENAEQIYVRQLRSFAPTEELSVGSLRVGRDQFDGGIAFGIGGEKNRARFAGAEVLAERETAVDGPAFPLS